MQLPIISLLDPAPLLVPGFPQFTGHRSFSAARSLRSHKNSLQHTTLGERTPINYTARTLLNSQIISRTQKIFHKTARCFSQPSNIPINNKTHYNKPFLNMINEEENKNNTICNGALSQKAGKRTILHLQDLNMCEVTKMQDRTKTGCTIEPFSEQIMPNLKKSVERSITACRARVRRSLVLKENVKNEPPILTGYKISDINTAEKIPLKFPIKVHKIDKLQLKMQLKPRRKISSRKLQRTMKIEGLLKEISVNKNCVRNTGICSTKNELNDQKKIIIVLPTNSVNNCLYDD